jgi:hypothetical protein
MKDLVVIIPSRSRPENIHEVVKSFDETKTTSDLFVVVDEDDPKLEDYFALLEKEVNIIRVKPEGKGMARPLNEAARFLMPHYRNFCFIGDDHRPRTEEWDKKFVAELDKLEIGLVYGNDLLQGRNLPTAVAMTGNIVKELNGMVPNGMVHLYLDNFWMKLGTDLGAITYLDDVIIEHMHPIAGKAEWDDQYKAVNADDVYHTDAKAYSDYIASMDYAKLLMNLEQV